MRGSAFALLVLVTTLALALACSGSPASTTATAPVPVTLPAPPAALLPRPDPGLGPAQTELAGALTGATVTETESCAGCHADAAAQWRSSAHAFGSFNNPVYRVVVDRFRADVGKDASRFCGGCHDVALLVDGAMSRDVTPADPRGHGGITCRVCHGVESTRPDGNGSYVLASSPIPIPRDGDDESLRAHKARMAMPPLRTAEMCGSCHRSFLTTETGNPSHLVGQDELGAWQRSAYAGSLGAHVDEPIQAAECRTCHMPLEAAPQGDAAAKDGKIRSHRFAGANTWLAAMRGDGAQVEAVRAMLRGAASIDVAVATAADWTRTLPADGAPVTPGQAMTLDVVVRNERTGHRFPGGVLDAQDTWVEVEVHDARGKRLAEAGAEQQATGVDETAHRLRAVQGDEHGTPLLLRETQRFRAPVFNHTVAPRDAEVVRFRFDVPASLAASQLPLRVTARLRHRSRDLALAHAACADAKTTRGAAFAREVARRTGGPMDPCVVEPVTEIATSDVELGAGASGHRSAMPAWRRLYDHGLGMLHALQEDVESARPSLERALEVLPTGSERERAMVFDALAEVSIREGRTDEALRRLDEAAALLPDHPALAHARGAALGNVWRWKEATSPLREAALVSPLDDTLWSHVAVAYGSADEPGAALDATTHGLALSPRDADMLRVQALALQRLGASPEDVARAREAFARWRPPDDAPAIKNGCSRQLPWCALERLPVHVHPMRSATP
ncbi:MAG TPA: multiheme c-type cytochrome [Polyangiaceae bacterium]|nr:multiheme c-type cytochrome [Polyangiaceae bacterium]